MTRPDNLALDYSDPRSGRVDVTAGVWPGQGKTRAITAPEGIVPAAFALAVAPERGGGHAEPGQRAIRRTSAEQLNALRNDLSVRDYRILASLEQHPYLTTLHVQRLHFADHATDDAAGRVCRRVLKRLAGLRVIEHLRRRVGGVRAGSASFVWRIGAVGDRLLRQLRGDDGHARRKEPSLHHLDHCLAVAETHIRLLEAGRTGHLEVVRVETEPACWRSYLAAGAARAVLKPDLYVVTASGEFEDHWFVEVDRGTESLPTLLKKCAQYEQYRRTGAEQQKHEVFPRVLWLLPNAARIAKLSRGLKQARSLDASLHRMTTMDGLLSAVAGATS